MNWVMFTGKVPKHNKPKITKARLIRLLHTDFQAGLFLETDKVSRNGSKIIDPSSLEGSLSSESKSEA